MTAAEAAAAPPPPPGSLGLPFVGNTVAFLKDPGGFLERSHRAHGPIFKMRILGETMVALSGPDAIKLLLDDSILTRQGASPPHLQALLNPTAVPFIDGERHRRKKALLLQAFTPAALDAYLPTIERIVAQFVARWEKLVTFAWVPEVQAMCFAISDALFTGADADTGRENTALRKAYDAMAAGALALPVDLPFTAYGKALRARDAILAVIREALERHKKTPQVDLLSRLLEARDPQGVALAEGDIVVELVHFFFTAYTGIYSALAYEALLLAQHPDVMRRARDEVARLGPGPLTVERCEALRYVEQVTKEIRRYQRLVAMTFFALVKAPFDFHGFRVPAGWKAIGSIATTLYDEAAFRAPATFDPDRFSAERAEDVKCPHAFVPHGPGQPGQHRCGGEALADLLMKVFAVHTLRAHTWEVVPGQRLDTKLGTLFPSPKDGLRVAFRTSTASGQAMPQ